MDIEKTEGTQFNNTETHNLNSKNSKNSNDMDSYDLIDKFEEDLTIPITNNNFERKDKEYYKSLFKSQIQTINSMNENENKTLYNNEEKNFEQASIIQNNESTKDKEIEVINAEDSEELLLCSRRVIQEGQTFQSIGNLKSALNSFYFADLILDETKIDMLTCHNDKYKDLLIQEKVKAKSNLAQILFDLQKFSECNELCKQVLKLDKTPSDQIKKLLYRSSQQKVDIDSDSISSNSENEFYLPKLKTPKDVQFLNNLRFTKTRKILFGIASISIISLFGYYIFKKKI